MSTVLSVRVAGAILAGGRAVRYRGIPKGALTLEDGGSILDRLLAAMRDAGIRSPRVIANDPEPYREFGCPIVPDVRPGCGPLGGIESALRDLRPPEDAVLVLPCDLPGLSAREIDGLLSAYAASPMGLVYAVTTGGRHPLCAVVHGRHGRAIAAALDRGAWSVGRLWAEIGAEPVAFRDEASFFNVNEPGDLAQWQERMSCPRCR